MYNCKNSRLTSYNVPTLDGVPFLPVLTYHAEGFEARPVYKYINQVTLRYIVQNII